VKEIAKAIQETRAAERILPAVRDLPATGLPAVKRAKDAAAKKPAAKAIRVVIKAVTETADRGSNEIKGKKPFARRRAFSLYLFNH
jgi:hypothetical protein